MAAERKYVLDTDLFILGFRDRAANLELQRLHFLFAPFEYLSAVVAEELRAGTRQAADRRTLERHVLRPFSRRGRVVTPSARAWEESGDLLAALARRDGLDLSGVSKAFGNDILPALSCREAGLVLVTDNRRDFADRAHGAVRGRRPVAGPCAVLRRAVECPLLRLSCALAKRDQRRPGTTRPAVVPRCSTVVSTRSPASSHG